MADALQRVYRWAPVATSALRRHGLDSVPVWAILAQIHTESRGYARPERIYGDAYSAEGLLQIQPGMAETCGYTVAQIDGLEEPWADGERSIECWAEYQSEFVGDGASIWDHPLAWLGGPGTVRRSREIRGDDATDVEVIFAWYAAADETIPEAGGATYVWEYLQTWLEAANAYWRWGRDG